MDEGRSARDELERLQGALRDERQRVAELETEIRQLKESQREFDYYRAKSEQLQTELAASSTERERLMRALERGEHLPARPDTSNAIRLIAVGGVLLLIALAALVAQMSDWFRIID